LVAAAFARLAHNGRLTALEMTNLPAELSASVVAGLSASTTLRELRLLGVHMSIALARALGVLLPQLQTLLVEVAAPSPLHHEGGAGVWEALVEQSSAARVQQQGARERKLESLQLRQLRFIDAATLKALSRLTSLRSLRISTAQESSSDRVPVPPEERLSAAPFVAIAGRLTRLSTLDIAAQSLFQSGHVMVEACEAVASMKQLRALRLPVMREYLVEACCALLSSKSLQMLHLLLQQQQQQIGRCGDNGGADRAGGERAAEEAVRMVQERSTIAVQLEGAP
jgi:hypothetical protein